MLVKAERLWLPSFTKYRKFTPAYSQEAKGLSRRSLSSYKLSTCENFKPFQLITSPTNDYWRPIEIYLAKSPLYHALNSIQKLSAQLKEGNGVQNCHETGGQGESTIFISIVQEYYPLWQEFP